MLKNRPSKPRLHGSRSPPKRPTPRHGRRGLRPARVSRGGKATPAKKATKGTKAAKAAKQESGSRKGSKTEKVLELLKRPKQRHARRTDESNLLASPKRPWVPVRNDWQENGFAAHVRKARTKNEPTRSNPESRLFCPSRAAGLVPGGVAPFGGSLALQTSPRVPGTDPGGLDCQPESELRFPRSPGGNARFTHPP